MASSPFASANDVILWFGEKPCRAVDAKGVHCILQYSQSEKSTIQSIFWAVTQHMKKNSLPFALPYTCTALSQSKQKYI
jgi:hypothetical protein